MASSTSSSESSEINYVIEELSHENLPSPSASSRSSKVNYIVDELIATEESYVRELWEIWIYYIKPFESPKNEPLYAPELRGQSKMIYGNILGIYSFHSDLSTSLNECGTIVEICHCFVSRRKNFLNLYRPYCQNKPMSEAYRNDHVDGTKFFMDCQRKAGHLLPLSSYLLKPVQRITKYQLLFKDLLRYSNDDVKKDVTAALASMLDLLSHLNAEMHQMHISSFVGNLQRLGPLRLQTECTIYAFKKSTHLLSNKPQHRFLFLFDGGVLFCKKRHQPAPPAPEHYENKLYVSTRNLGFSGTSESASNRFELWDTSKHDGYVIQPMDERAKVKWIQQLHKLKKC